MAQHLVCDIEDDVHEKLRAMAEANGRSLEEEVGEILRDAALRAPLDTGTGVGTQLANRFRGWGLDAEIEEWKGQPARNDPEP